MQNLTDGKIEIGAELDYWIGEMERLSSAPLNSGEPPVKRASAVCSATETSFEVLMSLWVVRPKEAREKYGQRVENALKCAFKKVCDLHKQAASSQTEAYLENIQFRTGLLELLKCYGVGGVSEALQQKFEPAF